MQDEGDDSGRHHAEHRLPPVPPAVDKHQTHILEVAHGPGEELHQGVGQAVAGQHFNGIFFDCGYASVEGLVERGRDREEIRFFLVTLSRTRCFPSSNSSRP